MVDIQRGFIPIKLDRERVLRFTLKETWQLVQRYGDNFLSELYEPAPEKTFGVRLKDPAVLAGYLHIGLQWDAEQHGETLTFEQVEELITPLRYRSAFAALMVALMGTHASQNSGNGQAGGANAAEPAGATRPKASTSPARKASRSRSSASRRKSSGR